MDNITLYSSKVYLSEDNSNPDSYIAKFIICDFGRNKNKVALNREKIETWLSTLNNKPLVGKIKMKYDGTYDFSGHNVKIEKRVDENGNEYDETIFDTEAFGSFFNVEIQEIDGKEFIVASCEIWKRFSRACEIIINRIQEGTLHTSWEIAVEESHQGIIDGFMTKIIDAGRFIGHCLLAKNVEPAYDSSGLVEIASTDYDVEFAEALTQDFISQGLDIKNEAKEENILPKPKIKIAEEEIVVETPSANTEDTTTETKHSEANDETKVVEDDLEDNETKSIEDNITESDDTETSSDSNTEDEQKTTELSALTEYDLSRKVEKACSKKLGDWCYIAWHFPSDKEVWLRTSACETELDLIRMSYSVENDEISVGEPENVKLSVSPREINTTIAEYEKVVSEKDSLIVKASAEIAELTQYKEKLTEIEQEKAKAEFAQKKEDLISYVVKSKQITREEIEESTELSAYVENLDKKSLMAIVGERLSASVDSDNSSNIETSESNEDIHVSSNLNIDDEIVDKVSIMKNYIKGGFC